jgi:hypothetical protein
MNKNLKDKYKNANTTITPNNTLFILDWDDTLFPTTWTTRNNINLLDNSIRDQYVVHFQELDRILSSFLKSISRYGKVIIVTNATENWVKISAIVMPQTYNFIKKKISIVSARDLFSQHTKEMPNWKKMTFQLIIREEYKKKPVMNIISIGDAEYEHQALVELTKSNFDKIKYLKSFRLIRNPHHDQLVDQLDVLNTSIPQLWNEHTQICKTFKKRESSSVI